MLRLFSAFQRLHKTEFRDMQIIMNFWLTPPWQKLSRIIKIIFFSTLLLFCDHTFAARTINSATVDGAPSTSVSAGATITATVTVTTTGGGSSNDWESTAG